MDTRLVYGEFTVNDTTNTLIGVRTTGWIPSIKDTTGVTHPMSYYYDGTTADYIVVEIARHLLGENWLPDYVARANNGGIERVLV